MNRHFALILSVAAISFVTTIGKAAEPHPLVGTWKRVAARYSESDDWKDATNEVTTLKHITGSHFSFIAFKSDTKEVVNAFGGTVTIEGEKYIETVDYGPKEMLQLLDGKQQVFDWKIDGKLFTQSGTLSFGQYIGERWQRVTAEDKASE
jgi:hypothetical protein